MARVRQTTEANSKWRIALLTNVAFHLYPMEDKPIGRGKFAGQLPKWLVRIEVWMRGKRQEHWQVVCRPLVLFSMLGEILGLWFEKFGKKDPRIGLYLLGLAGASR